MKEDNGQGRKARRLELRGEGRATTRGFEPASDEKEMKGRERERAAGKGKRQGGLSSASCPAEGEACKGWITCAVAAV